MKKFEMFLSQKGCGGTTLYKILKYVSETNWSGSKYGFSRVFLRPSYQNGAHNNVFRGVPDVVANANPNTGYTICFAKKCQIIGGNFNLYLKNERVPIN